MTNRISASMRKQILDGDQLVWAKASGCRVELDGRKGTLISFSPLGTAARVRFDGTPAYEIGHADLPRLEVVEDPFAGVVD